MQKWSRLTYVLSHDHLGIDGSALSSHDGDLLGSNVVDIDKEALIVLADSLLEIIPSPCLLLFLSFFGHLCKLKFKV